MADTFALSTHARHWLFPSAEAIDALRRKTHETAAAKLKVAASSAAEAAASGQQQPPPTAPPIEDMYLLCSYYEGDLQKVCRDENVRNASIFTNRVLCTAQYYFKRFYLHVSPMEEEPKGMMLAAIYLAGKVEEERIQVSDLVPKYAKQLAPDGLLALEQRLLDALRFHLVIRSPFRCVTGLLQDLHAQSSDAAGGDASGGASASSIDEALKALHARASDHLCKALLSDAPLLFAPQQLALASLLAASKQADGGFDAAVAAPASGPVVGGVVIIDWIGRRFAAQETTAAAGAGAGAGAGVDVREPSDQQPHGPPLQQEALVALLDEVERASARQRDLKSESALAALKATDGQLRRLCKLLKRLEKASQEKRAAEERERREQHKRKHAAEREAETARLAAQLEEARVKVKQEIAQGGEGGAADGQAEAGGAEAFSVRKRSKAGDGSVKGQAAPPR